ncbi:MAG: glycosyltransferase family 4 protein [Bacteroidetes bacterium]|nr:glycosyltransferase family 4 protein [Bacteroidota bacterium]
MNIAIATPEFVSEAVFDGGLANYTYKLAKWLISKNHSIVIYIPTKDFNEADSFKYENINVVKVKTKDYAWLIKYQLTRFKLGFLISDKLRYQIQFKQYAKAINKKIKLDHAKNPFDIIHYPHLGGYAYYRPNYIPTIVRLSSSTELCQEMGGYGSSNLQVEVQAEIEYEAMKKADAVFGPSIKIAALAESKIKKKISIIETPYIKPEGSLDITVYNELLKGKKYILFFGSIGLIKGVGTISQIIYRLLNQHPDLYYVFVGKQLNNKINEVDVWDGLINHAGALKNRIIYIPSQKHSTLFPIIQHAELITLPSRTDNFPNTCIESMANKKIVIGTKGNGFDQLINDGENGFVIDVDDHLALLEKINIVLNMSLEEKILMEDLSLKRSESLQPDIVLNSLLQLYSDTIKKFKN